MARRRSFATGSATGEASVGVALRLAVRHAEMFGRADNREAEFVEGGAVLLGSHLLRRAFCGGAPWQAWRGGDRVRPPVRRLRRAG